MAANQQDLDAALSNVQQTVTQIVTEVQALIAKIQATPGAPDLTAEVQSLATLNTALQGAIDAAKPVTGI